ncbi:MAG TPA: dihydrofolate reductase [Thiobacillaceae bacterium]|nr:dihydrofolate reductase [Thiobacillaceae bacterium]
MPHQRISLIAALARNRVIGIENRLPWKLSEDLKHFRALTLGHHILMGRKTYESIGRPLPGRTTVIISRGVFSAPNNCIAAHSIQDAIAACMGDEEIFFVGGADLYGQALPLVDRLYLTEIQSDVAGDAWFPEFDKAQWTEVSRDRRRDEASGLEYHFVIYDRA